MIPCPDQVLAECLDALQRAGLVSSPPAWAHEVLMAPHTPPKAPPPGWTAVYVFSLSEDAGARCPAGANRVLKVGKVGANSAPRFQYQHYSPRSSRSNLARSLIAERVLWPWLGVEHLDEASVKPWMLRCLDREHVLIPPENAGLERDVERYFRGRFGPVFEG